MTGCAEHDDNSNTRRLTFEHGAKESREVREEGLEAASRSKDDLLVELVRDARDALQSIVGAVDLLLGTPLTAEQREYTRYALSAAEDLEGSVARAEGGLSPPDDGRLS